MYNFDIVNAESFLRS